MIRIGIIGKTNAGKTTLFDSMTLQTAEVSNYPFTTKSPNTGIAQAVTLCVHKEFGVQDNPKNSKCEEGWRFIPIEVTDLPGLIKGAYLGKGMTATSSSRWPHSLTPCSTWWTPLAASTRRGGSRRPA